MSFPVFFLYTRKAEVKMESKLGLEVDGVEVETVGMMAIDMRRDGRQHPHGSGRYLLAVLGRPFGAVRSPHARFVFPNQQFDCNGLHRQIWPNL